MEKSKRASKGDKISDKDKETPKIITINADPTKDEPLSLWPLTMDQAVRVALTAPPMPKREKSR